MGWSSGLRIAKELWDGVKAHIQPGHERQVKEVLIAVFEAADCDEIREADFAREEA